MSKKKEIRIAKPKVEKAVKTKEPKATSIKESKVAAKNTKESAEQKAPKVTARVKSATRNTQKVSNDIVGKTVEKLHEQLSGLKKELFNLRFQKKLGELKNTSRFAIVRKDVARIKTELSQRLKVGDK